MASPLKVLLAEHRDVDAALLIGELERGDFAVAFERVATEDAMRSALARRDWDVIVSAFTLPTFDAIRALALVEELGLEIPVIVIAETPNEEAVVAAMRAGARDVIATTRLSRLVPAVERERRSRASRAVGHRIGRGAYPDAPPLESLPVLVVALDLEGRIEFANRALPGHTLGEAYGRYWLDYVPVDDRPRLDALLRRVCSTGEPEAYQVSHLGTHGETLWFSSVMGPMRRGDAIVGAVFAAQDITELKVREEQRRVSDRMAAVASLAAGVAHDFNNVLSVITSFASLVRNGLELGDDRRSDVDEILMASERAVGLTRRLMTFTRQQPRVGRPVDLNYRLEQLRGLVAKSVSPSVALDIALARVAPTVLIDPFDFDQMVLTLVLNARDAMPTGGRLKVVLEHPIVAGSDGRTSSLARLTVSDTGSGMEDAVRARIFDPFFTTKEQGKGTGLGLAMCFAVVEQSGGRITVESEVGKGTTFVIELPTCEGAIAPVPEPEARPRVGRGEVILVVEDEPALRRATIRLLRESGYVAHGAADGHQAAELIEQLAGTLDLVLSDLVMPGRSGYEVAELVSRLAPNAALLLTSGYVTEGARVQSATSRPILWKPVPHDELLKAVADAVAGRRTRGKPPTSMDISRLRIDAERDLVVLALPDEFECTALSALLTTAGYALLVATTLDATRRILEDHPKLRFFVCSDEFPDGASDGLLRGLRQARPHLAERVVVVADERPDATRHDHVFPVLRRPVLPRRVLELLTQASRLSPAVASERVAAGAAVGSDDTPPTESRPEWILLVDDDERLRAAFTRILTDAGFQVTGAGSLQEARGLLNRGEFDALVTDIGLPDGSGLDLLPELQRGNFQLPVVMVTGAPTVDSAAQAVRSGVSEYLAKPFPAKELVRAVRAATATGRATRLRTKLLAARFGGDEFVTDLAGTERRFEDALRQIRMVYQPILRSRDHSIFGYEALLRCDEPTLASPARLLAAAEVLGRVADLGYAVRESVARTLIERPDCVEALFVNIHPAELQSGLLVAPIDALLPFARRVVLEVTERASLESSARLGQELQRLRGAGYRIAVDDLGEGYAGLSSLVNLGPDIAKIDMSLIRGVHESPLKRDIISAIVDMARRTGILVVAEGIETKAESETLKALGCDLLQGYLFARPGPPFPIPIV